MYGLFLPLIAFITFGYLYLNPVNHDVAWLLFVSGRMTDGARLYKDYIDPTTPFIFYFQIPPAWFAHLAKISQITSLYIYISGFIVSSLLLCRYLINRTLTDLSQCYRDLAVVLLAALFAVLPLGNFGQREHLMLILVFPYILSLAARRSQIRINTAIALIIGILAGFGMSFKPFFLGLWFLTEAYVLLSRPRIGWYRPENLSFIATTAVYWVFFFLSGYLKIVPFLMDIYGALHISWAAMIESLPTFVWLLTILVYIKFRKLEGKTAETLRILCVASTAFFFQTFIQRKDWFYHNYPLWAATGFIAFLLLVRFLSIRSAVKPYLRTLQRVIPVMLIAIFIGYAGIYKTARDYNDPFLSDLKPTVAVIKTLAEHQPIYIFTTNITLPFPIVNYTKTQWPVRFHCLWPLWSLYGKRWYPGHQIAYRNKSEMGPDERFVFNSVIHDLIATPPKLMAVDTFWQPVFRRQTFNFIGYFSQGRRFRQLFRKYKYICSVGRFNIYLRRSPVEKNQW